MTLTYIRPDADDTDGTWTNEADSNSNLFASIDETVANDTDYIKSAHLPDHDICKIRLSDPSGMVMRPATVHYRFKKKGEASTQINLDVSLLQGATEIAKWSESDIGTSYVDGSQALTVPQFNAITDFTDLYLQFDAFSAWWLAGSSIDLDFASGLYYDSGAGGAGQVVTDYLSCSRASVGYATTSSGTLTSFSSNVLRITDQGLLVEGAATNTQIQSQDLTQASVWTPNNLAVGSSVTAPDGTSTAQQLTENAVNDYHRVYNVVTPTVTAGAITGSVYFKDGSSNGRRYAGIHLINSAGNRYSAIVDLQTGLITQTGTSSTPPSGTSSSVETLGSGWYRLIATLTTVGTTASLNIFASNSATPTLDGFGLIQYTGDNVSNFYAWGLQLENGSFASSYIPTTSLAVTRAADAVSCIGNLDTLLKASARTSVVDLTALGTPVTWDIVSGSSAGNELVVSSSDVVITSNTTTKSFSGSAAFTTGVKVGAGTSGSATSVTGAGLAVATGASGAANTGTVYLGSDATNYWYGYIRRATFWNSKIADATLQGFTAP